LGVGTAYQGWDGRILHERMNHWTAAVENGFHRREASHATRVESHSMGKGDRGVLIEGKIRGRNTLNQGNCRGGEKREESYEGFRGFKRWLPSKKNDRTRLEHAFARHGAQKTCQLEGSLDVVGGQGGSMIREGGIVDAIGPFGAGGFSRGGGPRDGGHRNKHWVTDRKCLRGGRPCGLKIRTNEWPHLARSKVSSA